MRIEKQLFSIKIKNRDALSNNFRKHAKLFEGNSKKGLIVGPSGCDESNVIMSLIGDSYGLRFENLYIYPKSIY